MTIKKILAVILSLSVISGVFYIPAFAADDEEVVYLDFQFEENAAEEFDQIKKNVESRTPTLAGSLNYQSVEDGKFIMRADGKGSSSAGSYATLPKIFSPDGNTRDAVIEYKMKMDFSTKYCYFGYDKLRYSGDSNMIHISNTGIAWSQTEANAKDYLTADADYGGHNEWHTYAFIYDKDSYSRRLFIDGVEYSNGKVFETAGDNGWFESGSLRFTFKLYAATSTTDNASFEYIKVYTPAENPGFRAYTGGYERNKIYIDFNTTVVYVNPEMITVGDIPATEVKLADVSNQIYEVTLESPLELKKEYEVSITGAGDSIGRSIEATSVFTTRDEAFYIENIKAADISGELEGVASGEINVSAKAVNEKEGKEDFTFLALSYDENGFMDKENSLIKDFSAEGEPVNINEGITVSEEAFGISLFSWKGAENPVPVSDAVFYDGEGVKTSSIAYNLPPYEEEATAEVKIKDDYSGITVTVDTKDETERPVGLLVKYNGDAEYAAYGVTNDKVAVFDIPLKEENVGSYSISFGIAGAENAVEVPAIEYFSPGYIERMVSEKINSGEANEETIADFTALLGEYLKLDTEGLKALSDKTGAYKNLIKIRDLTEEKSLSTGELGEAFSKAVKLARIYEGKGTEEILAEGGLLGIDEQTVKTFNELISAPARNYVSEKLEGREIENFTVLASEVKKYTILGGIYKASHYSLADTFAELYGEELGINTAKYYSLKKPEKAVNRVTGKEYDSLEAFASAMNSAITQQANDEIRAQQKPSGGGGGGGGGGGRISGTTYTPDKKEETKEEIKEEIPQKSYSDVNAADWFYSDVMWATKEGMFIGTSETAFSPYMNLTWEQITIVLGRIGYTLDNKNGSTDISRGDFAEVLYSFLGNKEAYKTRDEWISGTKIFIGDQNGDMMFEKTLTRAECCTVLRRISK